MQAIINFFEYTLSGWAYLIYFILMLIFSLACLGVVGEKVSKRKQNELLEKKHAIAQKELEKAKDYVKKQNDIYSKNNFNDSLANNFVMDTNIYNNDINNVNNNNKFINSEFVNNNINDVIIDDKEFEPGVPEVIILDAPSDSSGVVDNITPIVEENISEEENVENNPIPSVLIINEDGSSNI